MKSPASAGSPTTAPKEAPVSASIARTAATAADPRGHGRSVAAVLGAIVVNAVLSTATDQLFHVLDVYPPWGQPMYETGDNALALGYRIVYGILGGYLAARLAPRAPMKHALIYGTIGLAVSAVGAYVTVAKVDLGPAWYPLLLAAVSVPCAWLGGALHRRRRGER
jgi:hypothetical protein